MRNYSLSEYFIWQTPPPKKKGERGGGLNYCGDVKIYKSVPPLSFNDAPTFCFVIKLLNTLFIFYINLDPPIQIKWKLCIIYLMNNLNVRLKIIIWLPLSHFQTSKWRTDWGFIWLSGPILSGIYRWVFIFLLMRPNYHSLWAMKEN